MGGSVGTIGGLSQQQMGANLSQDQLGANPALAAAYADAGNKSAQSYESAQGDKPSKKSAGKPPDYNQSVQQQAASSQANVAAQTAQNRPDINTPFSTQSWAIGPNGTPQFTTGLAGGLGGAASALGNQVGGNAQTPLDTGTQARDQAINASYGQATSRLDPQFAQQQSQLDSQLAAQGLDPNSEAYRNAEGNFDRTKNDAYSSALNSAIGQGTNAQQVTFGENLAAQQAPLQELQGLQGLTGTPQFNQAGVADPTQYFAAQQAQTGFNQQQSQLQNSLWADAIGAVGQVAGGAAKLSDERAKTNIRRLAVEALPGVPFATWDWNPGFEGEGSNVGVIAQDLAKVAPQYVSTGEDGYLRVDYRFLEEGER